MTHQHPHPHAPSGDTFESLAREIDHLTADMPHGTVRTLLRTLRAVLAYSASTYTILLSQENTQMPADTTKMNQNDADAKAAIGALAAAHGASSQEAQSIADDAAGKFADLRDTANTDAANVSGNPTTTETPATPEAPAAPATPPAQ